MKLTTCAECHEEFDLHSREKRRAGGLAIHCPQCSHETTTRYLGLQSADGKAAGVTILSFESDSDRESYRKMWWVNSGMMVGKSCQLGIQARSVGVPFKKVHEAGLGVNHKGKMQ